MTTNEAVDGRPGAPSIVNILNPLVRRLLRIGMPMGPNTLITIRGRTSGQLRTFPVAVLETGGRQFVFSSFGEVNWVRNLRAAGEATVRRGRRSHAVVATELTPAEGGPLLQSALDPMWKVPGVGALLGSWYGVRRDSTPDEFEQAVRVHPGFELRDAELGQALRG
jgi:deazaflavin-dependent oxidoreductase (nitroreductase family)